MSRKDQSVFHLKRSSEEFHNSEIIIVTVKVPDPHASVHPLKILINSFVVVPDAPWNVSAVALLSTTVQVSWFEPVYLRGILYDYKVRYKIVSASSYLSTISAGTKTKLTISSMQPSKDYQFQVAATVKGGTNFGQWSSVVTVKTHEGIPDAPWNVSAVALSSTTVQVSWFEPVSLRGILYDYKVRYKIVSASSYLSTISAGTKTKLTISSMQPSKDYHFQVVATVNGGINFGRWSLVVTVKTHEGKPSQPQNVKLSSITSSSVLVNITKPLRENGIVRNYTVRYLGRKSYNSTFEHNGFITVVRRFHSEFTSKTLSNLVPATNYTIDVAAVTGGGRGLFSERVTFETNYAASLKWPFLLAPPKPTMENQGSIGRKLTVRIGTASDINGPISEYRLSFLEGNAITCQQSSSAETIVPSKLPLKLEFIPGMKSVAHISTELKTLANYTICYRAATTNKDIAYYSQFTSTIIERKHLEKLNVNIFKSEAKDISFVIPLKRGPENTKEYHIIVLETGNSSKVKDPLDWKPSELGPYDSSTHISSTPYITGVLYNYVAKFEIGNGKEYESSGRRRRNADQVKYINAPLKPNTEYVVFQRAYLSAGIYFSSPWAGPFKTMWNEFSNYDWSFFVEEPLKSEPGETRSIEIIVGIIVPAIIVLALAVAVCYIRKRRSKRPTIQEGGLAKDGVPLSNLHGQIENPSYDHEYESLNNVRASAAMEEPSIVSRGSSDEAVKLRKFPRKVVIDQEYPQVSVQDFVRRATESQKRNYQGIIMEYENLDKKQQFPWDIATDPANQQKNVHADIFP
ncbi:uncharacterized protein LOC135688684, partial [Rhopilema esculentum]|uniref:uncharacterized protein LOC135688684 n=1 Tax=Rhopilema esculentum TaxID=499914 RepID=UPI0031E0422D